MSSAGGGSDALLSAAQLEEFERDGATLLPLPLTTPQLDRYEALWDRGPRPYSYGGTTGIICTPGYPHGYSPAWGGEYAACPTEHIDPDYIALCGEPCLEAIAKQVLRSSTVYLIQTSRMARFPDKDHPFEDLTPSSGHEWPARFGSSTEWGAHSPPLHPSCFARR